MNDYVSIDQFRKALGSGHRSNQFKVVVTLPSAYIKGDAQKTLEFICYAASVPVQSLENVAVNFRGLVANYAGDPTPADTWTISCYNPTSFNLRKSFIAWKRAYQEEGTTNGTDEIAMTTADIYLLGKNSNELYKTTLYNVWPRSIGEIAVTWENSATISTFECQLSYDYAVEDIDSNNEGTTDAGVNNTTTIVEG